MKNFRKLLAFTLVLAVTFCACLPLTMAEAADKLLGKITITFDKTSYAVGTPIIASYTISGGSGTYTQMEYSAYTIDDGSEVWVDGGELTAATGTITFTPTIGQEAYVWIYAEDSEHRNFHKSSDRVTITGGPVVPPLSATLTLDKTTCEVGTTITASYEVTGGSGKIDYIYYYCSVIDGGSESTVTEGELEEAKGSFTFTPMRGQEAYAYISGRDTDGRWFSTDAGPVTLTGGGQASNDIIVNISFSKSSYTLGSTITAKYTISGGSGSYPNIYYECTSYDGEDYIISSNGKLTAASGTLTFTPKYGQSAGVSIDVNDSEGRSAYQYKYVTLTDKALKKIKISKVTATSKKKIKIEWKKLSKKEIKKAKFIQVEVSTDKDFKGFFAAYKEVSPKKSSVTIKGLTKNTKYYVRIRTVGQNEEGVWVYSPWSSVKKVKTPKK